jgi:hypothetical protein
VRHRGDTGADGELTLVCCACGGVFSGVGLDLGLGGAQDGHLPRPLGGQRSLGLDTLVLQEERARVCADLVIDEPDIASEGAPVWDGEAAYDDGVDDGAALQQALEARQRDARGGVPGGEVDVF